MADETKSGPPGDSNEPPAKAVSIDDVNAAVAEAVTGAKADLETFLAAEVEKVKDELSSKLEEALKGLPAELSVELAKYAGGAEGEVSEAVRHELHHLHGLFDNIATTIEKSIGQRVSRNVAPRPEGHPLPSQIDAPPPVKGEGAETAESVG